ncbi:MAG: PIN domain-containing protein [Acidimicrobiales bacterium]
MFVEMVRLLIVLFATIAGHEIGDSSGSNNEFIGALFGACLGYVGGGLLGRSLLRQVAGMEQRSHTRSVGEWLTSAVMALAFGSVGALIAGSVLILVSYRWATPIAALVIWVAVLFGIQFGLRRSGELLQLAGLSPRPLANAARFGEEHSDDAMLVDTSTIIDGRLLHIARAGFIRGQLLIPRFVIDELQGIADAQDLRRRRRGRRGLELLDVLSRERRVSVRVLDDEVPEIKDADAKLVALARRLGVGLMTMDKALAKVAEVQGVQTLNLLRLSDGLRPEHLTGDIVRVELVKEGTEEGQAVGFLPDGSMVVVGDAHEYIGVWLSVRIGSEVETSKGRIFFGVLHDDPDPEVASESEPVPAESS